MLPSKQTTSKLFFGKWPYKICCRISGSWMVKRLGIISTLSYCDLPDGHRELFGAIRSKIKREDLKAFALAMLPFVDSDIQTRAEGNNFTVYCRDVELFQNLCKSLEEWSMSIYEPASDQELEIITDNAKKILCNKLPYLKYQYKVHIRPTAHLTARESFSSWIKNYNEKIRTTEDTRRWFLGRYTQGPYVYVEDQKMLTLISMFLGNNVRKIEEYILRSSINHKVEAEILV